MRGVLTSFLSQKYQGYTKHSTIMNTVKRLLHPSLLLFLVITTIFHRPSQGMQSPIQNLEASLAAATSQGTILALRCNPVDIHRNDNDCNNNDNNDCMVIITRSPAVKSNLTLSHIRRYGAVDDDDDDDDLYDLNGSVQNEQTGSGMLHMLPSDGSLIVGMTGFASDVRHLTRYLDFMSAEHGIIYGRRTAMTMSSRKVVRALEEKLSNVAMVAGTRPYGVEAIVVDGTQGDVFTMDPSGGSRKWESSAAAVGRYAPEVRKHLFSKVNEERPNSIEKCIHFGLECVLKACMDRGAHSTDISSDQFECLVVRLASSRGMSMGSASKCRRVKRGFIDATFQKVVDKIDVTKKITN